MRFLASHRFLPAPALLLTAALGVGVLALGGCQIDSHPDDKAAVYSALDQHDLASVTVWQDRNSGVIKLTGIVGSPDRKARAQALASQAAPGYTITNNITVDNAGLTGLEKQAQQTAQLDSAIQDHFKASLKDRRDLEKQNIQFQAENGTLYLKGSVASEREKKEVEELARKDPQVQKVVNELAVTPHKHATNS